MKIAELSIEKELLDVLPEVQTFHRIDIEYIAVVKGYNKTSISQNLITGLRDNLKHAAASFIWEEQVYSQLEQISSRIALQTTRLLRKLRTARKDDSGGTSTNHRYTRRERPNARLASLALVQAIDGVSREESKLYARDAESLLKQVLKHEPKDYQSHFELGWIYLFFLDDYSKASKHFLAAHENSKASNKLFSIFALRHLAKAYYHLEDYIAAEETMAEVVNSALHPDPEYQYEYARYLAVANEMKLSSLYLEQAIEKLPIYYTQATAEPDFKNKGIISRLLAMYKQQSVKYIRDQSRKNWQESQLSQLELPEELSTKQVFLKSCKAHEEEIKKHPFVIVKKNQDHISERLLKHSKEALLTELIDQETHCMRKIGHKRNHWKIVNKSGGFLIHMASILLLAAFFVLAAKFVLVAVGLGTAFRFDEITGQVFIAVLTLGMLGAYLLRSQPFGIKRLFQKSLLFRDAMSEVNKMR